MQIMDPLPFALFFALLGCLPNFDRLNTEDSLKTFRKSDRFLDVWDVPISKDSSASPTPESVAKVRKDSELESKIASLKPQGHGTIRVFIEEMYDENAFNQVHKLPQQTPYDKGFNALMSQLRVEGSRWCELKGFEFFQQDGPLGRRRHRFRRSKELRENIAQTSRRIHITKTDNDFRGLVFISCETRASESALDKLECFPFFISQIFTDKLLLLEPTYAPLRTRENWKQLFALQYYHANLNQFTNFLQRLTEDYVQARKLNFDPRTFKLRQWLVKEITADSVLYQEFKNSGNEMTTTIESLLDLPNLSAGSAQPQSNNINPSTSNASLDSILNLLKTALEMPSQPSGEFSLLEQELRGCCKDISLRLSRLSDDLEHDLKFLDLSRNISQTISVQQLAVLATLFLPMSLAAGLLSMSTRFADLGPLLYDFVGVLALVVTFIFLVLIALTFFAWVNEKSGIEKYKHYRRFRPILTIVFAQVFFIYGSLVLTSFLVGMFDDIVLGAKILGFGTLAIIGIPLLWYALDMFGEIMGFIRNVMTSIAKFLDGLWKGTGGKPKRKGLDVEGDAFQESQNSAEPAGGAEVKNDIQEVDAAVLHDGEKIQGPAPENSSTGADVSIVPKAPEDDVSETALAVR